MKINVNVKKDVDVLTISTGKTFLYDSNLYLVSQYIDEEDDKVRCYINLATGIEKTIRNDTKVTPILLQVTEV